MKRRHSILIRITAVVVAATVVAAGSGQAHAQSASESVASGTLRVDGVMRRYQFRRLPVSSFPEIPSRIAAVLTERGCMIPQTWQAHRPENVIHGSFEHAGTEDWAMLCSVQGTTSLLVFLADAPVASPTELAQWQETARLQAHDPSGVLGFNWGIDAATPRQFHDAFASQSSPPATPDHDAVADSVIDTRTTYHLWMQGQWQIFEADQ